MNIFISVGLVVFGLVLCLAGSWITSGGDEIEMFQYAQKYMSTGDGLWPEFQKRRRRRRMLGIVLILIGTAFQIAGALVNFTGP